MKILFAVFLLFPLTSLAQPLETYFNTLRTFQADFTQTDPDGTVQTGSFKLLRPNKFIWQYEHPFQHKLISTGSRMFFVDGSTEGFSGQITQVPMNFGLAGVLTQPTFSIRQFNLIGEVKSGNAHFTTLELPAEDGLTGGSMMLKLDGNPQQLTELVTTNPLGQTTQVVFSNIRQNQPLSAKQFNFTPPHEAEMWLN